MVGDPNGSHTAIPRENSNASILMRKWLKGFEGDTSIPPLIEVPGVPGCYLVKHVHVRDDSSWEYQQFNDLMFIFPMEFSDGSAKVPVCSCQCAGYADIGDEVQGLRAYPNMTLAEWYAARQVRPCPHTLAARLWCTASAAGPCEVQPKRISPDFLNWIGRIHGAMETSVTDVLWEGENLGRVIWGGHWQNYDCFPALLWRSIKNRKCCSSCPRDERRGRGGQCPHWRAAGEADEVLDLCTGMASMYYDEDEEQAHHDDDLVKHKCGSKKPQIRLGLDGGNGSGILEESAVKVHLPGFL